MWSHFGGVLSFLPSLIIFLVFKDRGAFTKQESKEALNWQITWAIIAIVWSIVVGIIGSVAASAAAASGDYTAALGMTSTIGLLTYVPYIANLIFSIMGGAKISGGAPGYRYPVNFRFIK